MKNRKLHNVLGNKNQGKVEFFGVGDNFGSPIYYIYQTAVVSKNVEAVELLLSVGSDPNTLDSAGRCPLTNVMWEFVRNLGGRCEIDPDVMSIIMLLIQAGMFKYIEI